MSDDLVARLGEFSDACANDGGQIEVAMLDDAIATITRLRTELQHQATVMIGLRDMLAQKNNLLSSQDGRIGDLERELGDMTRQAYQAKIDRDAAQATQYGAEQEIERLRGWVRLLHLSHPTVLQDAAIGDYLVALSGSPPEQLKDAAGADQRVKELERLLDEPCRGCGRLVR